MLCQMNYQPVSHSIFTWRQTVQWVVGALATVLLAWLTYSRNGWVPWLSNVDLGIHELGHMLTFWAPVLMVQFAGSFLQVAVPLCFAGYFLWRRDRLAVILMLAWAAESLHNVSVYIYDATRMVLLFWVTTAPATGTTGTTYFRGWGCSVRRTESQAPYWSSRR